jgi:hypothetical protein
LEIPLTPTAWLTVLLPGPQTEPRPEGRFRADPRIPESEIELHWGEVSAVPRRLTVLTVSAGDTTWTLEQDIRHPERWRSHADAEVHRAWL